MAPVAADVNANFGDNWKRPALLVRLMDAVMGGEGFFVG
jgi:hypothetical protein